MLEIVENVAILEGNLNFSSPGSWEIYFFSRLLLESPMLDTLDTILSSQLDF